MLGCKTSGGSMSYVSSRTVGGASLRSEGGVKLYNDYGNVVNGVTWFKSGISKSWPPDIAMTNVQLIDNDIPDVEYSTGPWVLNQYSDPFYSPRANYLWGFQGGYMFPQGGTIASPIDP